jgi:hypothetical protein
MNREEFEQLRQESYEYLKAQQDRLVSEFGLGGHERWDYDQDTGEFTFSDGGVPKVGADFQVVGSVSDISDTWLWSWANPSILDARRKDMHLVRRFGEEHGLSELTEERWPADEDAGWAMTNIAAHILRARGAYRCPVDNGFLFLIFTDVWRVA